MGQEDDWRGRIFVALPMATGLASRIIARRFVKKP
jgi:hypothetical protein